MKTKRSSLVIILALLLCASLAVSASAASKSVRAGIYGMLTGTVTPITRSTLVPTSTTVTQNPDTAYLKVDAEINNGVDPLSEYSYRSASGATSFSPSIPVYEYGAYAEVGVYVAHNVQGGYESISGFVCYNEVILS